jgi:hypothetical protein
VGGQSLILIHIYFKVIKNTYSTELIPNMENCVYQWFSTFVRPWPDNRAAAQQLRNTGVYPEVMLVLYSNIPARIV